MAEEAGWAVAAEVTAVAMMLVVPVEAATTVVAAAMAVVAMATAVVAMSAAALAATEGGSSRLTLTLACSALGYRGCTACTSPGYP